MIERQRKANNESREIGRGAVLLQAAAFMAGVDADLRELNGALDSIARCNLTVGIPAWVSCA